ncbi:MAG: hypothetical protein KAW02_04265, partial [candidate division Zixibacteria bacterium]|nr:hypothetical protein [candidate division Zixibacteria bacterium]
DRLRVVSEAEPLKTGVDDNIHPGAGDEGRINATLIFFRLMHRRWEISIPVSFLYSYSRSIKKTYGRAECPALCLMNYYSS